MTKVIDLASVKGKATSKAAIFVCDEENALEVAELIQRIMKLPSPAPVSLEHSSGIVQYGACRFCGQVIDTIESKFTEPEKAEEYASIRCQCPEAEMYRAQKKRAVERVRDLERAREQIDAMFGQGAVGYGMLPVLNETREYLYVGAVAIYDNKIRDITINIGEGVNVKVAKNAKDNLKISRKDTSTFSQEV